MSLFKCKMCGGDLEIAEGLSVAECEYCGTKQTVPKAMDENLQNLFNRANTLRIKSEFDKAEKLYEKIIQADTTQSEAYWGLILCKYGIEYVDDPKTFKKVPTCHRASYDSIIADDDYKSAIENADLSQRAIYEEQAKEIDRIQKEILALAQKEETYDVFICYKETDANGQRTQDSVIANDIYYQLTQEGFKVFYAAITLEGKLGSAYEPIIFAALNSAKVMLAIGTKPEHFNAVWVKNEWSRYLKIVAKDRSKLLIPCYRDMDAYELPEEFAHLQAQDMAKIGFINDLVRGIKKVATKDELKVETVVKETVASAGVPGTESLLERAFMFLEDGEWDSANEYCEKVLDLDPKNARAYLGKLMAELNATGTWMLALCDKPFDGKNNYQKAIRFGDEALKKELTDAVNTIKTRNENARLEGIYTRAKDAMSAANSENSFIEAAQLFESVHEYKDSAMLAKECREKAEEIVRVANLFQKYKFSIENEQNNKNRKNQAETSAAKLMQRHQQLLETKARWNEVETNITSGNKEIQIVQREISRLNDERSALGLFAQRRKREISSEIACNEEKILSIRQKITVEEIKKCGFQSLEALDYAVSRTEEEIKLQHEIIAELSAINDSCKIRDELRTSAYGRQILKKYERSLKIKAGDTIKFGSYEIDLDGSDQDIEWLVLEVKDGRALVISKYILYCVEYNTSFTDITWENCTVRKWLDNEFINLAFNDEERGMILTVTLSADKNPVFNSKPGNETKDRVFLLSIDEANKYFRSKNKRQCSATEYAAAIGDCDEVDECWWWLRSPGGCQNFAAVVDAGGFISEKGEQVNYRDGGVRPAMWIDLNAIE